MFWQVLNVMPTKKFCVNIRVVTQLKEMNVSSPSNTKMWIIITVPLRTFTFHGVLQVSNEIHFFSQIRLGFSKIVAFFRNARYSDHFMGLVST